MRKYVLFLLTVLTCLPGCIKREDAIDKDFVLGDLALERQEKLNFKTPETMDELNQFVEAKGGWIDNELKDGDAITYQYLNGQPAPMAYEDALKLKNENPEENPEENEAIIRTIGRLPDSGVLPPDGSYKEVDYEAEFSRHSGADVNTFNPLLGSTAPDFEIGGLMGLSLFNFTYDTFEPYAGTDMNVSWQSSADRLVDKVVIRDDITWSDGKPFTAYDVEFSYKVIMSSKVPIPAVRSGTDLLVNVKAYDEHTVVFFHEKAMPINIFNMLFPIIPKHVYEDSIQRDPTLTRSRTHAALEKNPVVAGPYELERRDRDSEVVMKRREGYYMHNGKQVRQAPFFKRIRVKISPEPTTAFMKMKKGDIETMELSPELWTMQTNKPDYTDSCMKVLSNQWTYFAFWWNLSLPMFSDIRVREALDVAFDHEEMMKTYRKGLDSPCMGLFAENSPWFPKDAGLKPFKRDVERAKQLLAEAGWKDVDNDGILEKELNGKMTKFAFTMIVMNRPDRVEICNLLKTNLREVGIDMTIQPLEFNVYVQNIQEKHYQASMGGWGAGADPYTAWNVWGSNEARNNIYYSNPEVDRLFKEGEVEFDREKRVQIYQKIHLLICQDRPCTWLFNANGYTGFRKGIRGIGFYARGPIYGTAWKAAKQDAAK